MGWSPCKPEVPNSNKYVSRSYHQGTSTILAQASATTNSAGEFELPLSSLAPGPYDVEVKTPRILSVLSDLVRELF